MDARAELVLWLDADAVMPNVNGVADAWNDKSTFKNNATAANDAQKPVVLTGTGASAVNGHQALRFDGATKFFTIAESASLRWTKSFVIEAVFRHAQAAGSEGGPVFSKATGTALPPPKGPELVLAALQTSPYQAFAEVVVGPPAFLDTDKNTGYAAGVPHRVRAAWDFATSTLSIQIDKTPPISSVENGVTGLDAVGHDVFIGNDLNNFHLKADLAEIVAIAGASVDPADVTQLQSYLDKKYGL